MRIFFGLLFATFINLLMDIFGYFMVVNSFLSNYAPANVNDPTAQNYIWTFFLKFIVISTLAWIMYRVMTMLDTPKKRVLFIFFIGSSLSIYSEVDLFWVKETFIWSLIIILGQSTNWLLTGFVLSRFMRPRHLGAL